jgi:DNA-directed RNA polymerase subunit RPC12/RpoP
MRLYTFFCPRCGAQFEPIDTRVDAERVCSACASRSAQTPLGTPRREFGRRRTDRQPNGEFRAAEFWLKVVVHLAGFAALFFTSSVAGLLACLRDCTGR